MSTKCCLYERFSPRPGAAECESIKTQSRDLREHAVKRGYEVFAELSDAEMSGDDEDRPGLWQAIAALKRGYILLCWKGDRLARSVYLSEYLHREVRKIGATIEYLHGKNGESPDDIMVRQILAVVDEHAKKANALRTKYSMLSQQKNGKRVSRFPPYGFQFEADRIVPLDDEQIVLRHIMALVDQGLGSQKIKQRLDADGVLCRGRRWHRSTIEKIVARSA